jgi:hypothetical protein
MKKISRLILCGFVLCGLMLVSALVGCNKKLEDDPQLLSQVTLYHSSPDAPDVNVFIDNEIVTTQAFKYKNYSNYLYVDAGNRNIRFNNFTGGANLVNETLNFELNKVYSLFLVNRLSSIELFRISDESALPTTGNGMVRFVHLSPDAPEVEISWAGQTTPVFAGQTFKKASAYKEVKANTYSMVVKVKGGSGASLVVSNVEIKDMGYFTILLEGFDSAAAGSATALSARVIQN